MRAARLVALVVLGLGSAALPGRAQQPAPIAGDRPACVAVSAAARYSGYGYNHLVTVRNGCPSAVRCTVSTDVTPAPTQVRVTPGASETVTTFVGSPARTFVPTVACTTGG